MKWNPHLDLKGKHAFMGASSPHWLNDDTHKLITRYINNYAQSIGTMIHEFACKNIRFKMPLIPEDLNRMIFYLLDKGVPMPIIESYDMTDILTQSVIM